MLSEKQLYELAVKQQTSLINIEREYIQNLFLNYFYAQPASDFLLFKGGTALRIIYRSPRYSEDLDFSTAKINSEIIEDLIQETMIKIDQNGIKVTIVEADVTSGGYLAIIRSLLGNNQIDVKLEISSRKKSPLGALVLADNPYIDSYTIMALKKEELIAEKVEALLNRKKPRDFFDLYFMLRANLLPDKKILAVILELVQKTKIDFKKELGAYLPRSHQTIIKGFKHILEDEIARYI